MSVEQISQLQAVLEEQNKLDEEELVKEEVMEAFREEVGEDWLANEPLWKRILVQFLRLYTAFLSLYFFLVSLALMGSGVTALTGKQSGALFTQVNNPIVGLMVGIVTTVLVQSSSTTTSIIVVLVGNQVIAVQDAVPMIMGANIGTSVTNTIVSLGFVEDSEAYARGFAGATVHDMFNYLNVLVLLPLELIVSAFNGGNGGLLQVLAESLTVDDREEVEDDFSEANPIKKITNPLLDAIIQIDKKVVTDHALAFPEVNLEDGEPCPDGIVTGFDFQSKSGPVAELENICPKFECDFCPGGNFSSEVYTRAEFAFDNQELIDGGSFQKFGDVGGGIAALIISFVLLIISLTLIVKMLTSVAQGAAQKLLVKSLNHDYPGGLYVSILVGCAITFVVQSSSITTSILTPLVAIDALSLENMFPYTLGANIGTTGTGLIAASAEGDSDGYTIALVHFFFNVIGTVLWFPIPKVRAIPLKMAQFLGNMAGIYKMVPVIYIVMAFFVYPLVVFGLSAGFTSGDAGGIAVATIFFLALLALHVYGVYFYKMKDGKQKFIAFVEARKERLEQRKKEREAQSRILAQTRSSHYNQV